MDLQDVANLTIPEGGVKTIHDKNNRLLWGAVGYDTKYAGNTTQQTYSGKNLIDLKSYSTSTSPSNLMQLNSLESNSIDLAVVTSNNYASWRLQYDYSTLGLSAGDTLTLNCDAIVSESGLNPSVRISKGTGGAVVDIIANWKKSTGAVTFNLPSDATSFSLWFYANQGSPAPSVGTTVSFSKVQLEKGSTATPYEPYVGGVPAPNPDYPQTVNVVTGVQTVTVSDGGNNTQTFTIDLGSTELCKTGTYQDKIYKSGDDWYIHKATGYITDTVGSTNITISGMVNGGAIYSYCGGTVSGTTITYNSALPVANEIYYQLDTPTDAQITDAILISQLNAVYEWLTRYGYYATVSGNLPLIIDQTNL